MFDIFVDHKYLWQIIATAIGTLMFCHFSLYLGTSLKLLDIPDEKAHSLHAVAVPLTGGIAVFISLIAGSLVGAFFLPADPIAGSSFTRAWFSSAMFGMLFLGLVDDRHQQSPRMRLICMLTLCATTVLLPVDLTIHSLQLPLLGWTLQLGAWSGPFMILCLMALINAVNMADGRNGVILGMGIVWCVALLLNASHLQSAFLAALLVGLCIALYYNLRGLLFMGDGGAYALAFTLGISAIWCHNQGAGSLSTSQVFSLFVIPVLDMTRLIFVRLARGQSPMSADHDHLHHRIERFVPWRYGLVIYLAMVALPIVIALSDPGMDFVGSLAALALYGVVWRMTRAHAQSPIGRKLNRVEGS